MARSTKRASQATVDTVHRLVGRELARQLRKAAKSKEPLSAALLSSAIAYLKLTDTREPAAMPRKADPLAALMPDFDALEGQSRPTAS